MSWIEIIADRKIRDAQEDGTFDDLPGKGKPLKLDFDPRVPPELRAVYRVMKEAGIAPDWVELDKEIRKGLEAWDARVEQFGAAREAALAAASSRRQAEERADYNRDLFFRAAVTRFRELNAIIDRFNLIVPSLSRQRMRIPIRERMAALEERFPRFHPEPDDTVPEWRRMMDESRPPTRMSNRMPLHRKKGSIG
jgi:DnaJ homolog subfamily C member 28